MYAWANMGHPSGEESFVLCSQFCDADEIPRIATQPDFAMLRLVHPVVQGITSTALDNGTPIVPGENVSVIVPFASGLT